MNDIEMKMKIHRRETSANCFGKQHRKIIDIIMGFDKFRVD